MSNSRMFGRRTLLKAGLAAVPIAAAGYPRALLGHGEPARLSAIAEYTRSASLSDSFTIGSTKPDASNTGVPVGTSQTDVTGDYTAKVAGATITGKRFLGYVYVRAANVTFRNCWFAGPSTARYVSSALANCNSPAAKGVLFERCTFRCQNTSMYWLNGVSIQTGAKVRVSRCDISYTSDGVVGGDAAGSVVTMTGNYVHDLLFFNNSRDHARDYWHPYWEHSDGLQISGGSGHWIEGNRFESYARLGVNDGIHGLPAVDPATGSWNRRYGAGITVSPDRSLVTATTIRRNWFEGGTASFQMSSSKSAHIAFGSIDHNRFGMDQYDCGNRSRYQIRYKRGAIVGGITTNYFDPVAVSVPAAMKGRTFSVGFSSGVRLD